MAIKRKLDRVYTPAAQQGFLGQGHTARALIQGSFSESDPFILLMDDVLDKQNDEPAGGPHPHAGFETVSLLLEGVMGEAPHQMKAGDFQIMTAGSGIIHTETIDTKTKMRLLQLWLNLPLQERWAKPRVQDIPLEHVPTISGNGVEIRLYSGSLAGITSPVQNYVPIIVADITLEPGTTTVQAVPANYNTFLYVIRGGLKAGEDQQQVNVNQVGWLDLFAAEAPSELTLTAGEEEARLVLYAGKPQGENIVSYGPFIGDTNEDIKRLYQEFRQGRMKHIATVPESQRILW